MLNASNNFLAIDLSPESIRVLDVTIRRGAPVIGAAVSTSAGEGGLDTLPERQIDALGKLLAEKRIKTKRCVAAVPTNMVTTRSVMIDPSKPQAKEDQIKAVLQNISTFDARDLLFDFWNSTEPNERQRTHEVLVVATQRSVVHRYLEGLKKLKLSCTHLDVSPCALASLIGKLVQGESLVGTVVLGEAMGYFAVVEKERVLFWRPFELPTKHGPKASLERVGDEVSKCVSHLGSIHHEALQDIYMFGNGQQDQAISDYIANRFNLKVKSPSPFEAVPAENMPADIRAMLQSAASTPYAAALGLALQPVGGRNG